MKISTKGRYALRFLLDLTLHNDKGYVTLKEISERQGISLKYLEQIVSLFQKSGCLKSARGPSGGYRLAKNPSDYTIGSILRITEGSLAPIACLDSAINECPRQASCSTLSFWMGLQQAIDNYVDNVTLEDLAKQQQDTSIMDFNI